MGRNDICESPRCVLLVLGQPELVESVREALAPRPFRLRTVAAFDLVIALSGAEACDLAIVDADAAEGAALERFVGCLRSREPAIPVMALTRRDDLQARLAAFARGVDDILTVPFAAEELVARVQSLVRRSAGYGPVFRPVMRLGDLELDWLNRRARNDHGTLRLTSIEERLLYLLAANAGRLLSRDQILDALWGAEYTAQSNVVDRHVRDLRAKLHDDWRHPRYIATVPGRGYRFLAPAPGS